MAWCLGGSCLLVIFINLIQCDKVLATPGANCTDDSSVCATPSEECGSSSNICQCSVGYYLSDNASSCILVDCSTAPTLENGFRSNGGATTYDAIATYQCDAGYTIFGDTSIKCQSTGSWETLTAVCYKDCPAAPTLTNGYRSNGGATIFGSTATYTCNHGYTISGDNSITCLSNGVWETLGAACTIKDCGSLAHPTNGNVNVGSTTYTSTATYTCNTGYYRSAGDSSRQCGSDGTWSGSEPTCSIIRKSLDESCGISPAVLDQCIDVQASCQPSTTGSSSYSCLCNSGYHPEGTECVANKPLGDNCSSAADCSDPHAGCLGSPTVCTCKAGYYDDNNKDTSGGNCLSMSQLRVQNIQFTTIGITSVTVKWDPPSGKTQYVDEYTVEWRGQNTGHSEGPFSNGKNTQRILIGLTPGEAYNVTITSVNRQTASDERTTSVTKDQATKPNKPGSLNRNTSDFDASDGTITLKWQANSGDSVRGYSVRVYGDGISKTSLPGTVSASFSTTGMKNGFTYSVSIVAKSQVYNDGTSNTQEKSEEYTDTFKTTVKVPGPPHNVQCKENTDSSQTLTWTVPQLPNGDIEGYRIDTYFHSNGSLVSSSNTSSSQTTGTVLNLQPGSYYRFRVYTINEAFTSTSFGAPPTYCATRAKVSVAPNSVTLTEITSTTLTVSWTPPSDLFGEHLGSSIKVGITDDTCVFEYIQKCIDCIGQFPSGAGFPASGCQRVSENNPETASALGGQQTYTVEELLPDINYTVSVMAVIASGRGHPATVYGHTLEEAPQKPHSLTATNVGATNFTLSWDIAGPRPGVTTFLIALTPLAPAQLKTKTVTGFANRSVDIKDLEEHWIYTITITASTSLGSVAADHSLTITTAQAAPSPVDSFSVIYNVITFHGVTVSWKMSEVLQRNGIINHFILITNATENQQKESFRIMFDNDLNAVYTWSGNVRPGNIYRFEVYAVNNAEGNGVPRIEVIQAPTEMQDQPPKDLSGTVIGLVVGLCCVAIIVVVLVLIILRLRRKLVSTGTDEPHYEITSRNTVVKQEDQYAVIDVFDIERKDLTVTNQKLGSGQFGEVWKGKLKRERKTFQAAVKIVKDTSNDVAVQDLKCELETLKRVGSHPNIVSLHGYCYDQGALFIVMEYVPGGDLLTFLRASRQKTTNTYSSGKITTLTQTEILRLALDIAKGMVHLSSKKVIHRDLAARNVLLGKNNLAKVSDFGLSRIDEVYLKTSTTKLPVRWLAYESLFESIYTTKSDVWSFGIVLWEITSLGGTPYHGMETKDLTNNLEKGYRLPKPDSCGQELYDLMLQCWDKDAEQRPTFQDLTTNLQYMLDDSKVYINLQIEDSTYSYADFD